MRKSAANQILTPRTASETKALENLFKSSNARELVSGLQPAQQKFSFVPCFVEGAGVGELFILKEYGPPETHTIPQEQRAAELEKLQDVFRTSYESAGLSYDNLKEQLASLDLLTKKSLGMSQALERKVASYVEDGFNVDHAIAAAGEFHVSAHREQISEYELMLEQDPGNAFFESTLNEMRQLVAEVRGLVHSLRSIALGDFVVPTKPVVVVGREVDLAGVSCIKKSLLSGVAGGVGNTSHLGQDALTERFPILVPSEEVLAELLTYPSGTTIAIGSYQYEGMENFGNIIVNPTEEEIAQVQARRHEFSKLLMEPVTQPTLKNGRAIEVLITLDSHKDERVLEARASKCSFGLVRTERSLHEAYLLETDKASKQAEVAFYRKILWSSAKGTESVCFRTLDLSNDKTAYRELIDLEGRQLVSNNRVTAEQVYNQLLRMFEAVPVPTHDTLNILFPNIRNESDWSAYMEVVDSAVAEFSKSNTVPNFNLGLQAESLEAADNINKMLDQDKRVKFVAIGTSDLCRDIALHEGKEHQFDNRATTNFDLHHPKIWDSLGRIANACNARGIPVHVCGKLGDEVSLYPLMIGAGISKFTADITKAKRVSEVVGRLSEKECQGLYAVAKSLDDSGDVERFMQAYHRKRPEVLAY